MPSAYLEIVCLNEICLLLYKKYNSEHRCVETIWFVKSHGLTINICSFPTELLMYDLKPESSHSTRRMQLYFHLVSFNYRDFFICQVDVDN